MTFAPVKTFCTLRYALHAKNIEHGEEATNPQATACAHPNVNRPFARTAIALRAFSWIRRREELRQIFGKRQRGRGDGRGESGEE